MASALRAVFQAKPPGWRRGYFDERLASRLEVLASKALYWRLRGAKLAESQAKARGSLRLVSLLSSPAEPQPTGSGTAPLTETEAQALVLTGDAGARPNSACFEPRDPRGTPPRAPASGASREVESLTPQNSPPSPTRDGHPPAKRAPGSKPASNWREQVAELLRGSQVVEPSALIVEGAPAERCAYETPEAKAQRLRDEREARRVARGKEPREFFYPPGLSRLEKTAFREQKVGEEMARALQSKGAPLVRRRKLPDGTVEEVALPKPAKKRGRR